MRYVLLGLFFLQERFAPPAWPESPEWLMNSSGEGLEARETASDGIPCPWRLATLVHLCLFCLFCPFGNTSFAAGAGRTWVLGAFDPDIGTKMNFLGT